MSFRIVPSARPDTTVKSTLDTTHAELGGHDALRYGTRSIKSEVTAGHPLEHRLQQWDGTQWELKLNMARQAYGMHAPIRMMMEKSLIEKHHRTPLLSRPSPHVDILMGKDETMDEKDVFQAPEHLMRYVL
ncbi:proteasome maturation factor UMP1-domain-containing protein [Spinellus fusiger]|nr:proteasome maturation factor UMP1-domain-containing protein [Spinellus fusiger]